MGRFSPEVPCMIRFFSVHLPGDETVGRVNQNDIPSVSETDAEAQVHPHPYGVRLNLEGLSHVLMYQKCGYPDGYSPE